MNLVASRYKSGAKNRGLAFEFTYDECGVLFKQPCYFCGKPPSNKHTPKSRRKHGEPIPVYYYNGIDRLDSSKGYIHDNCVPCCWQCNKQKAKMSAEEFESWILKAAEWISKRRSTVGGTE